MLKILGILLSLNIIPMVSFANIYEDQYNACVETGQIAMANCPTGSHAYSHAADLTGLIGYLFGTIYACEQDNNPGSIGGAVGCWMPKDSIGGVPSIVSDLSTIDTSKLLAAPNKCGSIIGLTDGSLGESISLTGLPFDLVYNTNSDVSNKSKLLLDFRYEFSGQETTTRYVTVKVNGIQVKRVPFLPSNSVSFTDYLSSSDLPSNGFVRSGVVEVILSGAYNFGGNAGEGELNKQQFQKSIYQPSVWGLGGWTISIHHYYDPNSKILYLGNGSAKSVELPVITDPVYGSVYMGTDDVGSEVYIFDSVGRHLETKTGLIGATKWKFEYLADNKLNRIFNRDGLATDILRNSSGVATAIKSPFGIINNLEMNSSGRLISVQNPVGAVHSMAYGSSENDLLSEIEFPSGLKTTFTYDGSGLLAREDKNTGNFLTLALQRISGRVQNIFTGKANGENNITTSTVNVGSEQHVEMDSSGNTISSVQATDNLLYATDDSSIISSQISNDVRFGNLVRVPTSTQNYARGATTIMQQIDNSQSVTYQSGTGPFNIAKLIQNVTLNGKTTQITFDGVQKTIEEKSPLNNITRYELDDKERIKKVISPGFMDTDITYDSVGNISELKQGIRKTNFFYNNSGNLISEIDANNHETKFEYDNVGRLTKKTFPNGEYVGYEYTAGGALKKIRAPNGEYHEFQTGLLDQITSYLPPALSFGASSTTYNYDADGKLLNLQKPSGKFANYKYKTGTNFLEKIETSLGNYEFNGIDTVGRAAEITSPDGIKVRTMWVGDKISSIQWYDGGSHVGVINYSYNSDFQLSSTQIQSQPALSYNYDLEGKLTQAGEETYTYETQTNRGTVNDKYIISANYIVNGTLGAIKSRYATNARTDLVDQSVTKISDVNFLTPQLFGRSFQSTLNEDLVGNVTLQTELKYGLIPNPIEYKVQTWRDTSFGTIKHVLLRCWIQMAKLKSNMFMVHTV